MAPLALQRLTALQLAREGEMEGLRRRLMNKPRDTLTRRIVQSRLDALKEVWLEVRKTHSEIIGRGGAENEPYVIDDWFERIQGVYENALDEFLALLTFVEGVEEDAVAESVESSSHGAAGTGVAKLPRIPLPTFSGKYEDWASFCDLFTTLVHDVAPLSDATKLQYLKLCLTGSAADLIKDVTTTSANYASTWQALKARYHNPRLIVNKHLASFMQIPHLKTESASELRSFVDEAQRIVRALANLKVPVDGWDIWLVFVLAERLDPESRRLWEAALSQGDSGVETGDCSIGVGSIGSFPKFTDLIKFLEQRTQALNMIALERRGWKRSASTSYAGPPSRKVLHASPSRPTMPTSFKCPLCSGPHSIAKCYKFQAKTPSERVVSIKQLQLCFNCLRQHRVSDCSSNGRCAVCQKRHHTLLHQGAQGNSQGSRRNLSGSQDPQRGGSSSNPPAVSLHAARDPPVGRRVLLATARVQVMSPSGGTYVRALLDQGSESSFVAESVVQLLGLTKKRASVALSGLGSTSAGTARARTQLVLRSRTDPNFELEAEALVLPQLTSHLPSDKFDDLDLQQFEGLTLADPDFSISKKVDVILGADVYGQLLRSGLKRFPPSQLVAQNTAFGWVVSGAVRSAGPRRADRALSSLPTQVLHCSVEPNLEQTLQRFWTLEEIAPNPGRLKPEDEMAENLFTETHSRDSRGRYEVRLPLKAGRPRVADETRSMALKSLSSMQRRLSRDARLADAYGAFMKDYERLGHMTRVQASEIRCEDAWYLPHHAVVQDSGDKYKVRVVFDASRKTRGGHCLNDFLLSGPPLQGDLSLILLNWRKYRFAFTADIVKMFRQIRVKREDRDSQRIVWAPTADSDPVDYRLNTVTYGTTCAPYLAIRTLSQLVVDEGVKFPLGAECLKTETYVDDTFAGADDLSTAVRKRLELTELLGSAGLELDKWSANHPDLLPPQARQNLSKEIDSDAPVKTLGIHWIPSQDEFRFRAAGVEELSTATTKRSILSNVARLFDPLGWLAPITVTAKVLLQDLWIQKCDWDSPLPAEFRERWYTYCKSLTQLPLLSICRWLGVASSRSCQIHGFSDASSRAYAAVAYLRIDEGNGRFSVSLLAAKTKVAPVKTVSIPNLELCGAALLVKLLCYVRKLDFLSSLPVFAWSDSQIVLMWLRKHPCHWKTFVANRVSFIQTELPSATWAHVPTKENPADLATRGSEPSELAQNTNWWHGPPWLSKTPEQWPQPAASQQTFHAKTRPAEPAILTRCSSLTRLIRVVAFCRRPLLNFRRRRDGREPLPSFLSSSELTESRLIVIRLSQAANFALEIEMLKSGKDLPKSSGIKKLNPFLDKDEILRVGGRLSQASLTFDRKHPPILSQHSALSVLFVRSAHRLCLHGGPTLTTSVLMQQAWILGRKRLVKSTIRQCVTCQRVKPQSAHQLMGDLPADRVQAGRRPFSVAGLDYAGPVQVRTTKGRGHKSYKGYIAVFVCFSTRAIHLELVSDLTSASFICAYRRFVGRRGVCQRLYSDNATNFHGADNELKAMFHRASEFYHGVAALLANDGTDWSFIPPSAPHYGGLWEAGVKSVKHHLKRVMGEHTLTFEELSTVLVEIEACLNSRPLGALSSDPDDLHALTPFHFLVGSTSALLPEDDLSEEPQNRLNRFQLLQRIRNQFWRRWSSEYLLHLQEREKWRETHENFCIGRLVLVRDDRYPPSKWPLGRIVELHPGPDDLVRVVTVKTATTTFRRHISRLCPLHLEDDGKVA